MKKILMILLFLLPGMCISYAQEEFKKLMILGTILDVDGTLVENAIIMIDGKQTKIRSDADGNYSIKVNKSAQKIGIIAFGTGVLEEDIEGRNRIDFMFSRTAAELPEFENNPDPESGAVNTGYGSIKKKYIAGAVGFLDVEHSKRKYSSLQQILMETPGLIFVNGMFIIAGSSNFQGFVPPLFVVDENPVNELPSLAPSQVSSVTVLKGSSAAIYGTRAFGGAVIITTKIPE
jgi:TonB-dependent SusC/RagA subfamily outer membrane receptor